MEPSADPKSVKVGLTTGSGVDIEWKDGHRSHYSFIFLRDACPCALCDDENARRLKLTGSFSGVIPKPGVVQPGEGSRVGAFPDTLSLSPPDPSPRWRRRGVSG